MLDSEIMSYQFLIDFVEIYRAGKIEWHVKLHRKSLTEDYLLELECNDEPQKAIEEARAKINDEVLIQYASEVAGNFDLEELEREQKLFMDVKSLVLARKTFSEHALKESSCQNNNSH